MDCLWRDLRCILSDVNRHHAYTAAGNLPAMCGRRESYQPAASHDATRRGITLSQAGRSALGLPTFSWAVRLEC